MNTLHPKVAEFKEFIKRHPEIVKDVRSKKKTWQELFEDWYMFGEDDRMWDDYKVSHTDMKTEQSDSDKKKDSDFMQQMMSMIKNMDMNDLQKNLNNVSGAISNVQQLIEQFQGLKGNRHQPFQRPRNSTHPFFFHKD